MRRRSAGAAREDDAAVAAAEAAPHHLLERDVAGATVRVGQLRARAHHRRRSADVQLYRVTERPTLERFAKRNRDAAARAEAAVLGAEQDGDAKGLEEVHAVEL